MRVFYLVVVMIGMGLLSFAQQAHPSLILTKKGVELIRSASHFPLLYQKSYDQAKKLVEREMALGIDVPVPKDMAGGYTHERHKLNYKVMQQAGFLYQISGEEKYAIFIRDMLIEYADMFPSLPIHPTDRSYATGKIFWQCLNDANWLVYTSQAYDCVYDFLTEKERNKVEVELFKPYADFISIENPKFFNRVHNHSTWGNAAVGMIALVMDDQERLDRALYGIQNLERNLLEKDNDGGFIYDGDKAKAGIFAQMDYAFSPDGYYTEGPYYQRYAMTPFMLFAMAIENSRPDLKIFEYRDGVLLKAVATLVNQSNSEGEFFPINDAQKGMSIKAFSVVSAVDISYYFTQDDAILSIADQQAEVRLDHTGFLVARNLEKGKAIPFRKQSLELRDGANGDEGALGILRAGNYDEEEITVVYKYTAQGLGHGHYDKLSYLIFDNETEVFQDYGAARWVNIDQKAGGRYLKENKSWAKQSVAHNTLVIDRKSHFGGKYEIAKNHHSEPVYFHVENENLQIAVAKEKNAYPGVEMERKVLLWKDDSFVKPVVIDIMEATSDQKHDFDLPYHYVEHLMQCDFEYAYNDTIVPMGDGHGYQHLYAEGHATIQKDQFQFNWFNGGKFYTLTSIAEKGDELTLARTGANDPEMNLRRDALIIHSKKQKEKALYFSIIESHGKYSPVGEIPVGPYTSIKGIELLYHGEDALLARISSMNGKIWHLMLASEDYDEETLHKITVSGVEFVWQGPFKIEEEI